jgi:hypothetical protein
MKFSKSPLICTALRPTLLQTPRLQPVHSRLATNDFKPTTGAPGDNTDKGTAKVYNKDGTNPNKNLVYVSRLIYWKVETWLLACTPVVSYGCADFYVSRYIGLGALGLGTVYWVSMAEPKKVAEKVKEEGR